MGFGYVVVAGVAVIVTVFILQNTDPATVRFLMWRNDALPLALLLLGSVVAGLLVAGVPLAILAGLTAVSAVLGFLAAALGARRYGASRWGVAGALIGGLVGIFFGPLGLLIGCVAGAVAGELLRGTDLAGSVRSGVGSLVGLLAGLAADLVVSVTMIGLFVYWVWSS